MLAAPIFLLFGHSQQITHTATATRVLYIELFVHWLKKIVPVASLSNSTIIVRRDGVAVYVVYTVRLETNNIIILSATFGNLQDRD